MIRLPISYALSLAHPLDKISQRLYMRAVVRILRAAGLSITEFPLWIAHDVYLDIGSGASIEIGERSVISRGVRILTHDYSLDRVAELRSGEDETELYLANGVRIGAYAFIGMGATILPGVNIGRGSIIAAGAVVTKSVPDDVVAGGNPARVIKTTGEYWESSLSKFVRKDRRR